MIWVRGPHGFTMDLGQGFLVETDQEIQEKWVPEVPKFQVREAQMKWNQGFQME